MKLDVALILRSFIIFILLSLLSLVVIKITYSRSEKHVEEDVFKVTTNQGTLRGISMRTHLGRNISAFLGIPFAEPPIGSLRFAAPVPRKPWNGTLQATKDGADCAQLLNGRFWGEEDCLRLNVYTPKLPRGNNSGLLPTMVFVFGGGFVFGSSASKALGPRYLLDEDVLLVVPNYRLGPLGFMSTGDEVVSGNYGFKDLVLAFEWVQQNIKFFGGDPSRVTLFGHSSGAAGAHVLGLSPLMRGLFHRYITQSGSAFANRAYLSRETCRRRAFQLGEFVGCSTNVSTELVECLRKIHPKDIVIAQSRFKIQGHTITSLWASTDEPGVDGAFLPDSPANLVAAKQIPDVPWMTGIARDDGLVFSASYYNNLWSLKNIVNDIDQILTYELLYYDTPTNRTAYLEELKGYYLNDLTADRNVLLTNVTRLMSDTFFFYPALYGIKRQANFSNSSTYFYNFDYVGTFSFTYVYCYDPVVRGVAHGDDLIYLYELYNTYFKILNKSLSITDLRMKSQLVSLWTSFANYGVPLTSPDTKDTIWKPYDEKTNNVLHIGNGSSVAVAVGNDFYDERMRFLDDLNSRHFKDPQRHGLYYDRLFTGKFAAPVSRRPWNGTFNATVDGPVCPQMSDDGLDGQEDCLNLNLFTPCLPKGNKTNLLPTMVFIFGGAFLFGSIESAALGPQYLLDEDVLLVVPSYRLGALGFMSTGDEAMPGNYALKDLVLAFKWIKKNIKFFGGDPTRVTLFGHSSGGATAHLLALSPLMNGLFHRYITQSGSAFANRAYIPKETCRKRAFEVGQLVGCSTNVSSVLVQCLREKELVDIISVTPKIQVNGHSISSVWGPTDEPDIKGALLTDSPANLVADGRIPNVPWLTGVTTDDGLLFTGGYYHDPTPLKDILLGVDEMLHYDLIHYGSYINQTAYAEDLKKYYLRDLTADIYVLLENVTQLASDAFFIHPAWYAIQNQAVFSSSPTYLYIFDYTGTFSLNYIYTRDTKIYGADHGDELIYMFDLYHRYFSDLNQTLSSNDVAMKDRVISLWASFATYGVPYTSPNNLSTIWEPYDACHNYVLRIGHGSSPEVSLQTTFDDERMRFWDELNARYFNDSLPQASQLVQEMTLLN